MIAPNLINAERHAVLLGCVLQFGKCNRNAVNQEHDIGAVVKDNTLLPPLIRHLEEIVFRLLEVDDLDVALTVLIWDEHRLFTAKP